MFFNVQCDIIMVSIGGLLGWFDGFWVQVGSCFVDKGVVVIIFVGNLGENGVFFGSSGFLGKGVIVVVFVEIEVFFVFLFDVMFFIEDGEEEIVMFGYFFLMDYFFLVVKDWFIVFMNFDVVEDDGCEFYFEDIF